MNYSRARPTILGNQLKITPTLPQIFKPNIYSPILTIFRICTS